MVLFFGWWIFLIHWSTEYHFFSILMVPMAIIAGLGADGLLRFSTRIFVPVLTALILLLMFYNADLVTIRKSDPNNSPIRPLYEIAKRSDVDNVLFITRDYLAPHRIAFLFRENINVNAAACAYTIGSKNEIIFQEPSEYNHCSLIGNEGLLVVQSIDVNMAMILTALIDPNVASKPIGYLKLSKFNSIMIFFFKY